MVYIQYPRIDKADLIHKLLVIYVYATGVRDVTRNIYEEEKMEIDSHTVEFWYRTLKDFYDDLSRYRDDLIKYLPKIIIERGVSMGEAILLDLNLAVEGLREAIGMSARARYDKIISALNIFIRSVQEYIISEYVLV